MLGKHEVTHVRCSIKTQKSMQFFQLDSIKAGDILARGNSINYLIVFARIMDYVTMTHSWLQSPHLDVPIFYFFGLFSVSHEDDRLLTDNQFTAAAYDRPTRFSNGFDHSTSFVPNF